MQATIVAYYVYRLSFDPATGKGDALVLGLTGLWEVIPAIGFSLFSGHFVDLAEKKGMALKGILGYFLLGVFFYSLTFIEHTHAMSNAGIIRLAYVGIFVGGAIRAFLSPAIFALFGLILPRNQYARATTWSSAAWQVGFVIGPLLAGSLIAFGGFGMSMIVTLIIEAISLFACVLIPRQKVIVKDQKEPIFKSLSEGVRFVFKTQLVLATLSLDMFAVLFGGAVALLPVYADEILKVGEIGFGWMRAAPGIGSILMLFILSARPLKKSPGIKLYLAIIGFGITTILFGLCGDIASIKPLFTLFGCPISAGFVLALAMLFLGGVFDSVSVVIRSTVLQLHTPDEMRGRVAAVNTMFISSSNELGGMESGLTAKLMGTVPAVVFGGVMTVAVVGVTYFVAPSLKKIKLETT